MNFYSVILLPGIVFTYLLAPLCLYFFLSVFTKNSGRHEKMDVCVLALGMAPLLIAFMLDTALSFMPGFSSVLYVGVTAFVFLVFCLAGLLCNAVQGQAPCPIQPWKGDIAPLPPAWSRLLGGAGILLTAGLLGWLLVSTLSGPLTGADSLEYGTLARLIFDKRDNSFYIFPGSDPDTGFYSPMTHPLGYVSMIVWSYMLQGSATGFGIARLVPVWAALQSVLLLCMLVRKRAGWPAACLAPVLLLMTYFSRLVQKCHIDPLQTQAYLMVFFCLYIWMVMKTRFWLVLTGIATGLCMFVHSSGFLALPFVSCMCLMPSGDNIKARLRNALVIGLLATVVGGSQYIENQVVRGRPLGDDVELWELPGINQKEYIRSARSLDSGTRRFVNGFLQCWTKPAFFGITPWLGTVGIIFAWIHRKESRIALMDKIFLLFLLFYFSLVLAGFLSGSDTLIRNERYFIFIQPVFAYFAVLPLGILAKGKYDRIA